MLKFWVKIANVNLRKKVNISFSLLITNGINFYQNFNNVDFELDFYTIVNIITMKYHKLAFWSMIE